jgi:hypothetical protein
VLSSGGVSLQGVAEKIVGVGIYVVCAGNLPGRWQGYMLPAMEAVTKDCEPWAVR